MRLMYGCPPAPDVDRDRALEQLVKAVQKSKAKAKVPEKHRANYVPAPHYFALNQACDVINRAFSNGSFGCYLVGSSLERANYRDVDVRCIMSDAAYDQLFRTEQTWCNPLWSLMCTSISVWLAQMTGLPIDFQIQRQSHANEKHPGKRSALGVFLDYPGERPTDVAPKDEK